MTATQSNHALTSCVQEILRLKRLFNANSRIARLPAHILALIFVEHATTFYQRRLAYYNGVIGEHIGDSAHKDLYSWTTIAHVCHHWREVALNCAQIWTNIVLDERVSPRFNELLVKRARGLPLNVVLHSLAERYHCYNCRAHSDHHSDPIGMLPGILPNTRKLSIFIEREDHEDIWEALQHLGHATKLESLHFGGVGGASYFRRGEATVEIPDQISAQSPPLFSSLELWGVKILWRNSLYCASLRRLKISHYLSEPDAHLGHLLAALGNMPRLEILIIDAIPPANPEDDYQHVTLSNLRDLQIPLFLESSASLLSFLLTPSSTSVRFSGSPAPRYEMDKEQIPDSIQQAMLQSIIALLRGAVVHTISYVENEGPRFSSAVPYLRLWAADIQSSSPLPWAHICSTCPRIVINERLGEPSITRLLAALDLSSVRTIAIDDDSARLSRLFIEGFRGAENLLCLCLRGEVAYPVGAVLSGWSRPAYLDSKRRREVEEITKRARADEVDWTTESDLEALPPSWYGFGDVDGMNSSHYTNEDASPSDAHVPREGSPRACGGPYPLFPHLQTLVVEAVDFPLTDGELGCHHHNYRFCQGADHLHTEFNGIEYGFPAKGLARSLQLRAVAGVSQVVRVEFKDCQCLEKERLIPLVEVASTVVWDGRRLTMKDVRTPSKKDMKSVERTKNVHSC